MWILFALITASILASRKIQEKRLVWDVGWALWWMIRFGSAITTASFWLLFSRDINGITDWRVWLIIFFIGCVLYPLQIILYFRSLHELPLSLFGMLAGIAPLTSFLFSRIFFNYPVSIHGFLGIFFVIIAMILLLYKHEHADISLSSIFMAVWTYTVMGIGSVMDKIALSYTNPFLYAFLNQTVSAIILFSTAYFFSKWWAKIDFFQKNKKIILFIGISQWIGWIFGTFAIFWTPNPGYTTALINTHAIITAIYGVCVLKEKLTKKTLSVFISMCLAILCFAFA